VQTNPIKFPTVVEKKDKDYNIYDTRSRNNFKKTDNFKLKLKLVSKERHDRIA